MRSLATWLVVGGLAVLALFAARDALHGEAAAPAAATVTTTDGRPQSPPGFAGPPRIAGRDRLARELRGLHAEGVLYLTDANCRRFLLRLPSLAWTPQGLPGPVCPDGTVVDERFGLEARQVDADVIEVRSEDWRLRFEGNGPAFRPEGRLTFLRNGRLFEWTVRCPPAAERVVFRGLHELVRCPRPVPGAPERLRELVWLSGRDFVAVAGGESYSALMVVRAGKQSALFRAIGARMGALEASPTGRYVAVRIDGNLAVFDATTHRPVPLPSGADGPLPAIAWSPDGKFAVMASLRSLHVYPASKPEEAVTLPLAEVDVDWR
jgi:hypothetical protein